MSPKEKAENLKEEIHNMLINLGLKTGERTYILRRVFEYGKEHEKIALINALGDLMN